MNKAINSTPIVAIVGQPNVGKSSLFNRLINKRKAITSDISGTTRDRIFEKIEIENFEMILVDTGGLETEANDNMQEQMQKQARIAIEEADLIIYLVDGKKTPTLNDYEITKELRKHQKKIIFVANKCDNKNDYGFLSTWSELGIGIPEQLSCTHYYGFQELKVKIIKKLKTLGFNEKSLKIEKNENIELAFIGRPNAGKSSLINKFIKDERLVVSDTPGTTRDSIDIHLKYKNKNFTLIDTAGLRKKGKIEKGIEKYSSMRALNAIEKADITCLIMDYTAGIRSQDQHICSFALKEEKGIMLIINKCDLMKEPEKDKERIINLLKKRFDFLSWAPVIFVSAKDGKNMEKILDKAKEIHKERNKIIEHEELVDFLQRIYHAHIIPHKHNRKLLMYDMKQTKTSPPGFEITLANPETFNFSYQRYIENKLREQFGFIGTAIQIVYKPIDTKLAQEYKAL